MEKLDEVPEYHPAGDKLKYNKKKILGKGGFATVFEGLFEDFKPVAIKRFQTSDVENEPSIRKEAELMLKANDHPNIIRYYCMEMTDDFLFIATELCAGTLEDLINEKYNGPRVEDTKELLLQVTEGLAHLHRIDIIHRDIKPCNILLFFMKSGAIVKPQMKLADFSLCNILKVNNTDFTNTSISNPSGSRGWISPELFKSERYDYKVDIFPLGCVFGYTLSGGKHPFGDDSMRQVRIEKRMPIVMTFRDLEKPFCNDNSAFELIKSMVEMEPSKRPTAEEVLKNKFFVSPINTFNLDATSALQDKAASASVESLDEMFNKSLIVSENQMEKVKPKVVKFDEIRSKEFLEICQGIRSGTMTKINRFYELVADESVDINTTNSSGWAPIHFLCNFYGDRDLINIIKHLIKRNVNVDAKTKNGRNSLHLLCEYYKHENLIDLVSLLVELGADVNATTKTGVNSLFHLCENYKNENLIDLIQLLIKKGIDIHVKTKGCNALRVVCENYHNTNLVDVVQLFVNKGIDVNSKTGNGWNSVHVLCCHYKHENLIQIIEILITNGVDIRAKTTVEKWNALDILQEFRKNDNLLAPLVQILKENGLGKN